MELLLLMGGLLGLSMFAGGTGGADDGDPEPQTETPAPGPVGPSGPPPTISLLDETFTGDDDGNTINGNSGSDLIFGNGGADGLYGGFPSGVGDEADGSDSLYGGDGADNIGGGGSDDALYGGAGEDTLDGGLGDDTLYGEADADTVSGNAGDDLLYGGDGDDYFGSREAEGDDTIYGGRGEDTIAEANIPFSGGPNISVIDGGGGDDAILFDGGSTITGGGGDDALQLWHDQSTDGPSVITDFEPGSDSLMVYLDGVTTSAGSEFRVEDWPDGQGADLYYGQELLAEIAGAQGLDPSAIGLRVSLDQDGGPVNLTDGATGTTILGNRSDNVIFGGAGDDFVVLGDTPAFADAHDQGGADFGAGDAGNDTLASSGGQFVPPEPGDTDAPNTNPTYDQEIARDTLFGGDGDDVLLSENGNDLTGGTGADIFGISHLTGANAVGFTLDPTVITDFDPAQDEIVLTTGTVPAGAMLSIMVWPNGAGSDILAGGTVVAEVTGGQGLTVADIRLESNLIDSYLNA